MKYKIEISSTYYAFVEGPNHLVILNTNKKGYRCSLESVKCLKKSISGSDVYSVTIDGEIIWVSVPEFNENNLTETPVPVEA